MLIWFKNQWQQDIKRLVQKAEAPEKIDVGKVKSQFEKDFLKDLVVPTDKDKVKDYINGTFDQKYGPDSYEAAFRKVVQKYVKDSDIQEALIKESVSRYKTQYDKLRKQLANKLTQKIDVRNEAISGIRKATRQHLDKLVDAVDRGNQVNIIRHGIENGKNVNKGQLVKLVHGLNRQYFNVRLLNGPRLKPRQRGQYNRWAENFKNTMLSRMQKRADRVANTIKDPAKRDLAFKKLAKEFEESYEQVANSDGLIDYNELKNLNRTRLTVGLIRQSANNPDAIKAIENRSLLNQKEWISATKLVVDDMINSAKRDGNEQNFIDFAKSKTGKEMSFGGAAGYIRAYVRKAAELGVSQGMSALQEVKQGVYKGKAEILQLNDVQPKSIHSLVHRERGHLLSRRLIPNGANARIVVDFMSGNAAGRQMILKDPKLRDELFQAIKNIQKNYPKEYRKNWKRNIPKKAGDLRYSTVLHKPTSHDKAARLLAILSLANEAEWTVKNFAKSPNFKKDNLSKEFEDRTAEKAAPQIDLRFHDPKKKYEVKYITRASRGGFNGKDIALGLVKVWAGATIIMNVMNYRRELGWAGVPKALTNPYLLAAAGTIYGVRKYQKNPEVKNYLRETAGGQERIKTHLALTNLKSKVRGGEKTIKSFVHNSNEFNAIAALNQKSKLGKPNKPILKALKKAQVRAQKQGKKPTLSRDDLKQALAAATGGDDAYYRLPEKGNDRMRYLFYSKLLTVGRNSTELKTHCREWPKKVIS